MVFYVSIFVLEFIDSLTGTQGGVGCICWT
jgi:hypothetical protein